MPLATKTLQRRQAELSQAKKQVAVLDDHDAVGIPAFGDRLRSAGIETLRTTALDTLQVNLGKMCNQVCKHCHVDAGPDRQEIMTRATMDHILAAIAKTPVRCVDLTGGAPEMNPHFRWFVEQLSAHGVREIIVRCNLTIIVANPKYHDLPDFFKTHQVRVVSSLPYFNAKRTDAQRGDGVFDRSIEALKLLNAAGYGQPGSGLVLDLVYNPSGAFLPDDEAGLEATFKAKLQDGWGIQFNSLLAITNLPISRFLDYLLVSEKYADYMQELSAAFNPTAAQGVMCRTMLSVGWEGSLYDCDFNQMLEIPLTAGRKNIAEDDVQLLIHRDIAINQHCYGCTAGAGSSCGGATT